MALDRRQREEQGVVLARLRAHGERLARAYGLALRSIEAERPQVKRRYGVCYRDGSIRIRLHHARTGELLKYSSLVDTLCHELAHLRHFHHGASFHRLYEQILAYARRQGIYRPGPDEPQPCVARPSVGWVSPVSAVARSSRPPSSPKSGNCADTPKKKRPTRDGGPQERGPRQLELFLG